MGFILSMGLWIRQIGWNFATCSEKAREEFPKVLQYWPEVCDFTMEDIKPKKKQPEEVKEIVDIQVKRRPPRKVRARV